MSTRLKHTPLFCALALAAAAAHANSTPATLEKVVATASRTPQSLSELPRTAWLIEARELQEQVRAGVPLKEALGQLVASLDVGPQGRSNYGQNLRGRNVLVMVDGVSLNSSRGVSRQFDAIDPFNIAHVEVLSGTSAVFGGGATGGIINIVTRRGEAGLKREAEVGLRSGLRHSDDLDRRAAVAVSGGNSNVQGRVALAYQKNGAAFDAAGRQVTPDITQTDLQYNRTLDLSANLDWQWRADQTLKLSAQAFDSGFDGSRALYLGPNLSAALGGKPDLLEVRDGLEADITPRSRRHQLSLDYRQRGLLGGQDLFVQASARSEKLDFNAFPGSIKVPGMSSLPYYSTSRQNTAVQTLKAVLLKTWADGQLSYGLDLDREKFDASQVMFDTKQAYASGGLKLKRSADLGRYPGFTVTGRSVFAQADWKLTPQWSVSGGMRQQNMKVTVEDFVEAQRQILIANGLGRSAAAIPGGKNDYSVSLLNLGTIFKPQAGAQTWLNYSEGFDLPDPAKYYGQGSYTLTGGRTGQWTLNKAVSVADQPLAGIKTRQLELGGRSNSGGLNAQAALFYAQSDHSIQYIPSTLAIQVITQKTRNYGLEASLDYRLNPSWQVGSTLLAIRSHERQSGAWASQAVTAASPSKLSAFARWQEGSSAVRLQATQTQSLQDSAGAKLQGNTLVDLLASTALGRGTLHLGVQNLLNKQYATPWSQRAQVFYGKMVAPAVVDFQGRGRSFGVNYSVSL